jgi:hypothetical protein
MELNSYYKIYNDIKLEDFIVEALKFGKPIFTSIVGVFDTKGLGHRRDIELPFHRDGDYSPEITAEHSIDYVAMHCIRDGEVTTMFEFDDGSTAEFVFKKDQAIIFDNQRCKHARKGKVGDRLLLRIWIEKESK